jgi:TonB family protein
MRPRAALLSLALHFVAALALFLFASFVAPKIAPVALEQFHQVVSLRAPRIVTQKPGGSGDHSPLPAQKGKLPDPPVRKIFMPPVAQIRNENPKLVVEQALLNAPEISISADQVGDPFSNGKFPSGGTGGPNGIGNGHGGLYGDDIGPGKFSAPPAGASPRVKLSRQPQLIYSVDPEYSEEARKMRFQGTVVLMIDVDVNGRPSNIRVVRSVGLGLDERAIDAVGKWKFRPALSGDRPVAAPAIVEVSFHLL